METTITMKRDHSRREILRACAYAARALDCRLADFRGRTMEYVMESCEHRAGLCVFWGFWSLTDLRTII